MKFKPGDKVKTNQYFDECICTMERFCGIVERVEEYKQEKGNITNLVKVEGRCMPINEDLLEIVEAC